MTMLSIQEIRQLQEKEWREELKKAVREYVKADFEFKNGHTKASDVLKKSKRYIARLKTVKKEAAKK